MRRYLITAILYTVVTTIIFGIAYPYLVTGTAQLIFKDKADGQLIKKMVMSSVRESSGSHFQIRNTSIHVRPLQATDTMRRVPAALTLHRLIKSLPIASQGMRLRHRRITLASTFLSIW